MAKMVKELKMKFLLCLKMSNIGNVFTKKDCKNSDLVNGISLITILPEFFTLQ